MARRNLPRHTPPENLDLENVLSDLSYVRKDSNAPLHEKSIVNDFPEPERDVRHFTLYDPNAKEHIQDSNKDGPIVYPSPSPSYNPKKCPPDLLQAEKHGIAHKVGKFYPYLPSNEVCESTGVSTKHKELPLSCPLRKLYHLGPVIPMYFLFSKQMSFFAGVLAIVAGAFLLSSKEENSWSYQKMIENLTQKGTENDSLLFIVILFMITIVSIFLMYIFRRSQKATKLACKKSVPTASDYTVMASNIGLIHLEEEIKAFFSNKIVPSYSLDVQNVSVTYNLGKYVSLARELKSLLKRKAEAEKVANYITSGVVGQIQKQIEAINTFFNQSKRNLAECRSLRRNGLAFVSFGSKQEAKAARRKFEFSVLERTMIWILEKCTDEFPEYFFKGHYIRVEKAPELNDIIWENLNCNNCKLETPLLNMTVFGIILASTMGLTYMIKGLSGIEESHKILIIAAGIAIINEILAVFVKFLARYEAFRTFTKVRMAIQKRTAMLQFINSVAPLFLIKFHFSRVFADFACDVLIVSIATSFLPLLLRIINIPYIKRLSMRRKVAKSVQMSSNSNGITQEEANYAYEDPEFDIQRVYADTVRILLFSTFFFSISPAVALVAFCAYLLGYFVDKYNLLKKSLLPSSLRSEIAEDMFEFVDLAVFLFALGGNFLMHMIGDDESQKALNTITVFSTLIATIYYILPNQRFARSFFSFKKAMTWNHILLYQQAIETFGDDYHSTNLVKREKKDQKALKEKYKSTLNEFKILHALLDTPEILPLLSYAETRPSLYDILSRGLNGLLSPFYSFPQNYGYGYNSRRERIEDDSTLNAPLLNSHSHKESTQASEVKKRNTIKANEMVSGNFGNPAEDQEKERENPVRYLDNSQHSMKGGSLLKDLMLIPSYKGKKTTDEFEFVEAQGKEEEYSPNFGYLEGTSQVNTFLNSNIGSDGLTPPSPRGNTFEKIGILEGISPITGIKL